MKKNKKRLALLVVLTLLVSILATGCMNVKENVVVNKDGSGVVSVIMDIDRAAVFDAVHKDPTLSKEYTDAKIDAAFTLTDAKRVTKDGVEYYEIDNPKLTEKFSNLKSYYTGESQLSNEDNHCTSLYETAFHMTEKMSMKDLLGSSYSLEPRMMKMIEQIKMTIILHFDTEIAQVTSGANILADKKSVSFETVFSAKTNMITFLARCKNDIDVKGIRSGRVYTKPLSYQLPSGISATINGKSIKSSGTITKEGMYELIAKNKDNSQKTYIFAIDKSAPKINGIKNKKYYKSPKIRVADGVTDVKSITINGEEEGMGFLDSTTGKDKQKIYSFSAYSLKEGKNSIVVKDLAGFTTKKEFYIDRCAPTVSGVKKGKTYRKAVTIKAKDKYGIASIRLNGKKIKSVKKITKSNSYKLVVKDKAGNTKTVKFKVKLK